jgi:hypothetical protein
MTVASTARVTAPAVTEPGTASLGDVVYARLLRERIVSLGRQVDDVIAPARAGADAPALGGPGGHHHPGGDARAVEAAAEALDHGLIDSVVTDAGSLPEGRQPVIGN